MDEYSHCKRKGQCVWSVSKIATDHIKEKWIRKQIHQICSADTPLYTWKALHLAATSFLETMRSRWKSFAAEPQLLSQLWLQHSGRGCSSPLRAFPLFLSQPAPLGPHVCGLGAGFGVAFLLPGLLCSDRHQTATAAVTEVSGHCAHMTRLMITTVRGRRKRKRIEINDLLYQERTNYSANLLLLIPLHNLIH